MSVLIVEDHVFQREYLRSLFKEQGVNQVELASDGQEALQWLDKKEFDLILSDLMMPGIDGVQFIQRLALFKNPPRLALMSSHSMRILGGVSTVAEILGITVVDRISKPALPESIKALIDKCAIPQAQSVNEFRSIVAFEGDVLREALELEQFQAWFQPKIILATGCIGAAEALVRWEHPTLGTLLPGQFLAGIFKEGMDEALLFSVTRQTIASQASWRESGFRIPVSINLPTHLLCDCTLPDRLYDHVLKCGGRPSNLVFELTECSMTDCLSNYIAGVCRLRMKGFGLAQDDFGQGFSSFYNMVKTPFTELKIDRSLIINCETESSSAAALKSIIALGRELGLNVVAEGVENRDQLALLREFGCDMAQGFLISKAVPAKSFQSLLLNDGR